MKRLLWLFLVASAFAQISPVPGSGSPSGAAGGDLSGSYPNPTITSVASNVTFSANAAASAPGVTFSGTPFAGTGTTSTPVVYLNSGATAPTDWSANGAMFGINAPSGFTGDLIRLHVNGAASVMSVSNTGALAIGGSLSAGAGNVTAGFTITGKQYSTATNCSSAASPAVCSSAAAGSVVVAAAATTVQVNTSSVTANSQILLTFDASLGTKLSVTCNTTFVNAWVSARTGGTSFTITVSAAPTTNPACFSYSIIN